jgi:hypothetical protein
MHEFVLRAGLFTDDATFLDQVNFYPARLDKLLNFKNFREQSAIST